MLKKCESVLFSFYHCSGVPYFCQFCKTISMEGEMQRWHINRPFPSDVDKQSQTWHSMAWLCLAILAPIIEVALLTLDLFLASKRLRSKMEPAEAWTNVFKRLLGTSSCFLNSASSPLAVMALCKKSLINGIQWLNYLCHVVLPLAIKPIDSGK